MTNKHKIYQPMIQYLFSDEEWNSTNPTSNIQDKDICQLGILHHGLCEHISFTGNYQMPSVKPIICNVPKCIMAYYRTTSETPGYVVPHFFTDDKNIEKMWTYPYRFLKTIASRNSIIIGPDFSVYAELVFPQKCWNIFRNKLLTAWWQSNQIKVIPNISWINENYECSFDGWPKNSIIAVNSTGVGNSKRCKAMWISGYKKMLDCLRPIHILRYGAKQDGENESISTYYPNDNYIIARSSHGRK